MTKPQTTTDEAVQEPIVLHCLANAMEALMAAKEKTESGFLSDFCDNALREVRVDFGYFPALEKPGGVRTSVAKKRPS